MREENGVTDDNDLPGIIAALDDLNRYESEVGIIGDAGAAKVEDSQITMEQLAVILHEGLDIRVTPKMRAFLAWKGLRLNPATETIKIPPRPFLDRCLSKIGDIVEDDLAKAIEDIVQRGGATKDGAATWHGIARAVVGTIQKSMVDLRDPPNHPFTIRMKGSSNPLIDHEHLLRSVVEETRAKGAVAEGV